MRETVSKMDLKPGDVVDLELEAFGYAIVRQAYEGKVMVWRPYATVADFTYIPGRTIPYIGVEDFELEGGVPVVRVQRSSIREIVLARAREESRCSQCHRPVDELLGDEALCAGCFKPDSPVTAPRVS
jgi:bifunctional DNA-binding transcriptional regulator/antitoxin component of YhaV-PrlF toxin-antitoxin module